MLSLFLLTLYVFLQSAVYLALFTVDPKQIGIVGMAFVIVFIIETVWHVRENGWHWNRQV